MLCDNPRFSFNYHQIVLSDDIKDGEMSLACSMYRCEKLHATRYLEIFEVMHHLEDLDLDVNVMQ
jgi:hypothetical protein